MYGRFFLFAAALATVPHFARAQDAVPASVWADRVLDVRSIRADLPIREGAGAALQDRCVPGVPGRDLLPSAGERT